MGRTLLVVWCTVTLMSTPDEHRRLGISARAWVIWAVVMTAYFVGYFHRLAPGVLREPLFDDFGLSATAFAHVASAYFYAYVLLQIPAGALADVLGPRWLIAAGGGLAGLASLLFAAAPNVAVLFIARLCVGAGVSVVFLSLLKLVAVWFPERLFATMTGLSAGLGNLGGLAAQTPLHIAVITFGWRGSFAAVGLTGVAIAIACFAVVRDRPRPPSGRYEPSVQATPTATDGIIGTGRVGGTVLPALRAALLNRRTWPPFIVFMGYYGAFITLTGSWGQGYLVTIYGLDSGHATDLLMGAVLGFTVGGVGIGKLSDAVRRRRVPSVIVGAVTVSAWVALLAAPAWLPVSLTVVLIGAGSVVPMITLACGKEVNHPQYSGTATGVVNIGGFLGAALVPLGIGAVFDYAGGGIDDAVLYRVAFMLCLFSVLIAWAASWRMTETYARNVYFD